MLRLPNTTRLTFHTRYPALSFLRLFRSRFSDKPSEDNNDNKTNLKPDDKPKNPPKNSSPRPVPKSSKNLPYFSPKNAIQKTNQSLTSTVFPRPVLATAVPSPFLPGMKTFLSVSFDQEISKANNREIAYFLTRDLRGGKIKSLKDIFHVGTYGSCSAIKGVPIGMDGVLGDIGRPTHLNQMTSIKTVRALSFDAGYVRLQEYGSPMIALLKQKDMDPVLCDLFMVVKNDIFSLNSARIKNFSDLPTFHTTKNVETVEQLRSLVGLLFPNEPLKIQDILEKTSVEDTLNAISKLILRHKMLMKMTTETAKNIAQKSLDEEKIFYLKEQQEWINKELGKDVNPGADQNKFEEKITKEMPKQVQEMVRKQITRLSQLGQTHHESENVRNHLDWLTSYPWGKKTEDNYDLDKGIKILDEDHYGLKDIKDRIIEFIATGKLGKNMSKGKILCLVGPPGVGKTSLGKSIARALGRNFVSMSMGGLSDPYEIRGHRRAYVGAMPGNIIKLVKRAGTDNPLFMIDEIDKISKHDYRGDPAAALLDLFDPSQNDKFTDNFMEVDADLSNVLFVCTANERAPISPPLADRVEFIALSGYTASEKLAIAEKYLLPRCRAEAGLTEAQSRLSREALLHVMRWYCREPGVRSLERCLQKVLRKIAVRVVKGAWAGDEVGVAALEEFLGKRRFTEDRFYEATLPGVAMGLCWSEMGGSALYIECDTIRKREKAEPQFTATGQLGSVMSESISIGFSVAQRLLDQHVAAAALNPAAAAAEKGAGNEPAALASFFRDNHIHLHCPEGAVKKDGPSAGVTIACALLSLATKTPVKKDLAMTGELTLSGHVLPVGGIKEKMLSAMQAKAKEVVLPSSNLADWDELEDEVKAELTPHFAKTAADVVRAAFPGLCWGE